MSTVESILVVGLVLGCFGGLAALGFSVVHGVLAEANLAYGDAAVLAALAAVGVHDRTASIPLAMLTGLGCAAALMLAVELVGVRPLRGGDALGPILTTLGLALIIRNVATQGRGVEDARFPPLFGTASTPVASTSVDAPTVVAAVALLVLGTAGAVLLLRTDWGRAVRATRLDATGARLCGIPVGRLLAVLYGVCGVVGGLAVMLRLAHLGVASVSEGFRFTLVAYAASAFGGGRSIAWAVAGGLLLGMVASAVEFTVGDIWRDSGVLAVLIVVLLVRPRGLAPVPAGVRI